MGRILRGSIPASRLRGMRRKTAWEVGPGGIALTALTSTGSTILGAGVQATLDGTTTVRIRGELLMFLTSATAASDGFVGAFGMGKGSASAFAVGVGSMETPIDDEAWDGWLYHRYFALKSAGTIADAVANKQNQSDATTAALRIEVDSKAMRKVDIEDVLYAVIQVTETGTATAVVQFNSRQLIKLA